MNIETPGSEVRYIGKPLRRREDVRFLRGKGQFVDDVAPPGTAWCAFVRSPHGHARIRGISTTIAAGMPGVLLTLTAEDWKRAGHGELTVVHPMPFSDGRPMNNAPRPAFAGDKVRHVGDIVAAVVAESRFAAEDAAEAVAVDYEPLPSVCDPRAALAPGAPLVHERFGSNLVFDIERGNREKTESALAGAAKIVALDLRNSRLAANPLEPRAYLCEYDAASRPLHALRHDPAAALSAALALGLHAAYPRAQNPRRLARRRRRFRREGKFCRRGLDHRLGRASAAPAGALDRDAHRYVPVRRPGARSPHPRPHGFRCATAASSPCRSIRFAALGGYLSNFAPSIPGNSYPQTLTGLYRTPNLHLRVRGVYTNTVPVDAYRGSGRPEATWINERLIERGAHELGIDAVEIRRRNLIGRADFPYPAPGGRTYDSGDPPALLEKLLALADYPALRKQQMELRRQGILMGIGLACFIDKAGTGPSANLALRGGLHGGWESAIVRVHSDGKVTVLAGSHSHGQGHDITFAQIAADRLKLDIDDIRLVEGDTDRIPFGNGTWGARSVSVAGTAIYRASDRIVAKARSIAAEALECASADIVHERGRFRVHGTDRSDRFCGDRRPRLSRRHARRRTERPASKSPSSTIRPTPTIRRRCISRS